MCSDASTHLFMAFVSAHRASVEEVDDAVTKRDGHEHFEKESAIFITDENAIELDAEAKEILRRFDKEWRFAFESGRIWSFTCFNPLTQHTELSLEALGMSELSKSRRLEGEEVERQRGRGL